MDCSITSLSSWLGSAAVSSTIIILIFLQRQRLTYWLKSVLSSVFHNVLIWWYPIKDAATNSRDIPATPFWSSDPGGSGDEAKFLKGPQNSIRWGKLYGPLYRIWSGTNTEVVTTRAEHIKAIFHDSDRHIKAKNNDAGWMMGQVLGQCVGLLSGDEWSSLRAHLEPPFSRKNVLEFFPTMHKNTRRYFSGLFNKGQGMDMNTTTTTLNIPDDIKLLPFSLVAVLLYGEDLPEDLTQQLYNMVPVRERLFMHVISGGISRYWWSQFLPTEANRLLRKFQKDWLSFNQKAYEHAKKSSQINPSPIVTLWEQAESGNVDRTQLLQSLDEVLFANLDVTTSALSWLIVNMACNPSTQSRLYSEIRSRNLGNDNIHFDSESASSPALLDYINEPGTYLASCVNESARVRPVAAFSIPQAPPTDRVVGGYRIPANTSVVVDAYALNIRNQFWGPEGDAASFRPERWEHLKPSETRYQMWRFGFGPRLCMGRYIAEKMLRLALVLLVVDYELAIQGADVDFETTRAESWLTIPDVQVRLTSRAKKHAM